MANTRTDKNQGGKRGSDRLGSTGNPGGMGARRDEPERNPDRGGRGPSRTGSNR